MKKEKDENKFQEQFMQLQNFQQRLQLFSQQIQQIQVDQLELDNALNEIKSTDEFVFRIVGGLMIKKKASEVQKELKERKSDLDLRLKNLEKQENITKQKLSDLQKDVMSKLG